MRLEPLASLLLVIAASPALAADVTYRNAVAPMIKAQCSECHGSESPALADFLLDQEKYKKEKTGPRTSSYGDLVQLIGWPDSGAFMRRLDDGANTADKKPGNMYKYLGETDAERAANLNMLKAWVGDGAWNLNRWGARGDVPGVTKDQLDKLVLKY
jgi:mono/diheme cytochrome c family protein